MSASAADVVLACQPNREAGSFVFPYSVTNNGPADIYVFDALPGIDPATRQTRIDANSVTVSLAGDGFVHVLKGLPPPPTDRDVAVRLVPLAAKLPPGQTLKRTLRVPLPFAEINPYFPDLPLRQYEQVDIKGVIIVIEFLRSTLPGLAAAPDRFGATLFRVVSQDPFAEAQRVTQSFAAKGLTVLKRKG
ncbi:MAG: hypothetical protein JO264_04310, partial [Acidisphaera sp.]|nr:hypothetical protein [Acidisphaera sp.]